MRSAIDSVAQDVRVAARRLRADSAFSAAAVLTIGLVVGLSTAIFSVANAMWLRPLPLREPGTLVAIERPYFQDFPLTTWASVADYVDWRERARSFSALGMAGASGSRIIDTPGGRRHERALFVSANLLRLLGASPLIGRTFRDGEDREPADRVVVLGEELWRNVFNADPSILGKHIVLTRWEGDVKAPYEVIGVMPRAFSLEYDLEAWTGVSLLLPFTEWPADRSDRMAGGIFNRVYGRLRPGVSVAQAQAEMVSLCAALHREFPRDRRPPAVKVSSLHQQLLGNTRPIAGMLAGAVGLVLLVGCANVTSLLLGRGSARAREMAVRAALGSGSWRLVQQQLVDSLLVALAGGALGLFVAWLGTASLLRWAPPTLARVSEVSIDYRVLVFAFSASLFTGLAVGVLPALAARRPRLVDALKAGGRSTTTGRVGLAHVIVAIDVAAVVVLLVGASLMARSLWQMVTLDVGFNPHRLVIAEVHFSNDVWKDPVRLRAGEASLLEAVRRMEGVASASIIDDYPYPPYPRVLQTVRLADGREVQAMLSRADAEYAAVMGIPVLRGRFLRPGDAGAEDAAVVSRVFADRFLKAGLPARVQLGERSLEVVGVVGDVTEMGTSVDASGRGDLFLFGQTWKGLERSALPTVYLPRTTSRPTSLIVRTKALPAATIRKLPRVLAAIGGSPALGRVSTMEERLARTLANNRFYAVVLNALSLVALLLAAVGVHGVVTQATRRRLREIAIRTALGAQTRQVVLGSMRRPLTAVVAGALAGGLLALAGARAVRRLLFDIAPWDPWAFAAAGGLLVCVGAVAVFLPARRAAGVDPLEVLRAE